MPTIYCQCQDPLIDYEHDAGCRRCGQPVDFTPAAPLLGPAYWYDSADHRDRRRCVQWWHSELVSREVGATVGTVYYAEREHPDETWPPVNVIATAQTIENAETIAATRWCEHRDDGVR
jgi:hypothetical protein